MFFPKKIADTMMACINMHNIVLEFRRDSYERKIFSLSFFKGHRSYIRDLYNTSRGSHSRRYRNGMGVFYGRICGLVYFIVERETSRPLSNILQWTEI